MTNIEHTMELFRNYPYTEGLIKEHNCEQLLNRFQWHQFKEQEIAQQFQSVIETFEDLTSNDIPKIHEGREAALRDYVTIGNQLHTFSKEEGRHQLNLSNEDIERLFAKVELGGAKYCSPDNPQSL